TSRSTGGIGLPVEVASLRVKVVATTADTSPGETADVTGERTVVTGKNCGAAGSQNSSTLPPSSRKSPWFRLVPVGIQRNSAKTASAPRLSQMILRRCAGEIGARADAEAVEAESFIAR